MALGGAGKVIEIDESGRVLWEAPVPSPSWATRLRNGNTLVASLDTRKVLEIDRSGKVVWEQATTGRPFRARRR